MPRNPKMKRQVTWRSVSFRQKMIAEGSKEAAVSFWQDLSSSNLLPIKATFFFIVGATQCLAPFSTLFMTALGLKVEEVAIVHAISPLIAMTAPFLSALFMERNTNFKIFLVLSVAASGLLVLIYIAIPPARTEHADLQTNLKFEFKCSESNKPNRQRKSIMTFDDKHCLNLNNTINLDKLTLTNCGFQCPKRVVRIHGKLIKKEEDISVSGSYGSLTYKCIVNSEEDKQKCFVKDESKAMEDLPKELELKSVEIKRQDGIELWVKELIPPSKIYHGFFYCTSNTVNLTKITIGSKGNSLGSSDSYNEEIICSFHCDGEVPKRKFCNDVTEETIHDVALTIWLFLLLKTTECFITSLTFTMFQSWVEVIVRQKKNDYGLQKIHGYFGRMTFAPFTGFLIDLFGNGRHYSDYYISFGLFCGLKLICALTLTRISLKSKFPARKSDGSILNAFKNLESVLLIAAVFISGMCLSFIENFLPLYLKKDLKAHHWLIGLTSTVSAIVSIPCMAVSGVIGRKFGYVQTISFCIFCYAIRCIGYSLLTKAVWCLVLEILEGVTTGLLVTSAIVYGVNIADKNAIGTMQGILAVSHYGLGSSAGSLIGGYLIAHVGPIVTFRIFCSFTFLASFVYYLVFKLILFPKQQQLEKHRQEVANMPVVIIPRNRRAPQPQEPNIYTSTPIKKPLKKMDCLDEDIENESSEDSNSNFNETEETQITYPSLRELEEDEDELTKEESEQKD